MLREMLSRSCPCCGQSIPLSERLVLLNRESLSCKYCAKTLQPNFKVMLFNVCWLSMSVSWLVKSHTSLDYIWALSAALLFCSVVTPALDLLFSLEEEKHPDF